MASIRKNLTKYDLVINRRGNMEIFETFGSSIKDVFLSINHFFKMPLKKTHLFSESKCLGLVMYKKYQKILFRKDLSFGLSPLPVTVANEGLVRDPLLKI